MTNENLLLLLRRRLAETDTSATYTDTELMQALEDARSLLAAKVVSGMVSYLVYTDGDDVPFGFVPDVTDQHAHILVYRAVLDLLTGRLQSMLDAGALGISWRSGLEAESTIQADKSYRDMLGGVRSELDALILIQNRAITGGRAT